MISLWKNYWKVLFLSPEPFRALRGARGGLWFALQFALAVTLVASLGKLAPVGDILEQPTLAERVYRLASQVESFADRQPDILAGPIRRIAAQVEELAGGITEMQPPLGPRPSKLIRLLGEWLSTPFVLLAGWMSGLLAIWLVARALGSMGSLREHLSLSLLAVAPHVFTFANYLPVRVEFLERIRGPLSLVSLAWSLLILTQALAIAHQIEQKQVVKILVVAFLVFVVFIPWVLILLGSAVLYLLFF